MHVKINAYIGKHVPPCAMFPVHLICPYQAGSRPPMGSVLPGGTWQRSSGGYSVNLRGRREVKEVDTGDRRCP